MVLKIGLTFGGLFLTSNQSFEHCVNDYKMLMRVCIPNESKRYRQNKVVKFARDDGYVF
jgi:hypothetical protein